MFELSDTAAAFPRDVRLHDLFQRQVQRHPQAVAVEWQDSKFTYAQLDVKSDQLVARLQAEGVVADTIVALQFDKSLEMAVAILGVLKSGGAFLPMDPTWPLDRRQFILQDACCSHLIVQDRFAASDFTCCDLSIWSFGIGQDNESDRLPSLKALINGALSSLRKK